MTITNAGQIPDRGHPVVDEAGKRWEGNPLKISNSEMQTFKDCRRRWWLAYYRELGLKRENQEVAGPRSLGTRVHAALEHMYTEDGNPVERLKEVYDTERERLREAEAWPEDVAALDKEYDLAHAMVTGFLDWLVEEGVDEGIDVVAREEVVEVDSHIPGVKLRGKMDQRVVRRVDSARLFRDYKTVAELTTPPKVLPLDEQMKFYHLLEYMTAIIESGGEPAWRTDGALYTMLRKVKRTATAKPPFYAQIEVHHNLETIRNMWKRVAAVVEEIFEARLKLDAGADHQYVVYPRPSRDCTWKCDFFAICPMFDDGSNVEGMITTYYDHVDPHERYLREELKGETE